MFDILSYPYPIDPETLVLTLTREGNPESKARPRMGSNGNVYTPEKTRAYEAELRMRMNLLLPYSEPDAVSKFSLRCIFYRATRQRIDCDNLLKAVSDAATGAVWKDDAQVVEIFGRLVLADSNPRAEITIYTIADPAPRDSCLHCGKAIVTYPSVNSRYCSRKCLSDAKRVTLLCMNCNLPFTIPQSVAKRSKGLCSHVCSSQYNGRMKTKNSRKSSSICVDCGGPVSRPEYARCYACSIVYRQKPESEYWKMRREDTYTLIEIKELE